jgi:LPS-assembly protein
MISSPYLRALCGAALGGLPMLVVRAAEPPCSEPWQSSEVQWLVAAVPAGAEAGARSNSIESALRRDPGAIGGDIITRSDSLSSTAAGETVLTGNVDVHFGTREIQADQLTYQRDSNTFNVSGAVRYRDSLVHLAGDSGHYGADGASFSHAQFEFLKQPGHGTAEQISLSPDNVLTLQRVTYTSCPAPRADWQIRARELVLDTNTSRGVGRGATVDFEGVPIAYLPWISFPLSEARQSGFLFPDVGTSGRSGASLGVPWYWNIAPNQDATFTPTYYTLRGAALGTEYRFLTDDSHGTLVANYLPSDRAYGGERNSVVALDQTQLGWNTRIDVVAESVSDTEYFEDFTLGSQSTSTPFLPRSVAVTHRDDIWNLKAQMTGYQTLDETLPLDERPYIQLPALSASALWAPLPWPAFKTGFDSELVDFTRATGETGWRLDARPQLGLDVTGPGYFLRPSIAWDYTRYALRDAATPDTSPTRSLPILDFDAGLQFERQGGPNALRNITLEPRLMYVYVPYRDQSGLPVFDTSTPDPNLIELFRPNRFVGLDRIGDANAVTLGLTTQVFESASGVRYLSATVGQSYYLQAPRVTLPAEPTDVTGTTGATGAAGTPMSNQTSSLIGQLILTAWRHWNLQIDAASNSTLNALERSEVTVQYLASSKQVANVSYRYEQGQLEQADVSTAWPIGGHWDAYARAVYSLRDRESIEDFAGFQYHGSCWGVRLVAQRSVSTRTGERDTGVSVQLELNGLSNVGSGVSAFLEQSIRGYSASSGPPLSQTPTL